MTPGRRGAAEHDSPRLGTVPTFARDPLLWLAVWIGLAAGLLEAFFQVAERALTTQPAWAYSIDVLWMTPVASLAVFAVAGVGATLAARTVPRIASSRLMALALIGLAVFPLLRMSLPGLHRIAALLLTIGMAVRVSDIVVATRPAAFRRLQRRSLPWMVAFVVTAAVVIPAHSAWVERRSLHALPAPPEGAPNVLLLILDTVRNRNLSLYGYERSTTPNLERVAAQGVTFDRAIAPSPWTLPSHATIFTGLWPHEHAAGWTEALSDEHSTLAEHLAGQGYATGGFVANLYYASRETGLRQGFARYEDHEATFEGIVQRSWLARSLALGVRRVAGANDLLARKSADDVNRAVLDWIGRHPDRPFFVFANYYDAHGPYLPPPPFDTAFGPIDPIGWLADGEEPSQAAADRLRTGYDASISYLDDRIGQLMDELESRGVLDNTLVVITSDHGEEFFEHGFLDHGNSLYAPALVVPLMVRYPPSVPGGTRVADAVTLRDLPRTIAQLAGMAEPGRFPGVSLQRYWANAGTIDDRPVISEVVAKPWEIEPWYPLQGGSIRSIVLGDLHYIVSEDGGEELYDVAADPAEQFDLLGAAAYADSVVRLEERLRDAFTGGADLVPRARSARTLASGRGPRNH